MGKIDLQTLLDWTTNRQADVRPSVFRASDFYQLINDPFWIWCQLHGPKEEAVIEPNRHDELRIKRGVEFEKQWVKENYPEAIEVIPAQGLASLRKTLELMLDGVAVIYQPQLWVLGEGLCGKCDLLIRNDSQPSELGDYHYVVKEIKISHKIRKDHQLQIACYNYMLGLIQGFTPPEISLILHGAETIVAYDEALKDDLKKYLAYWKDLYENTAQPEPGGIDQTASPWRLYANKIIMESDDLTLIPNVGPATRQLIKKRLGITKVSQLAEINKSELIEKLGSETGRLVYAHALAYQKKSAIAIKEIFNHNQKLSYYFDFETSDDVHPGEPPHVYLIGLCDNQGKYTSFLGRGKKEEEKIFSLFLDFLEENGGVENVCLYHWADFEIGEIERLITEYPKLSSPLNKVRAACVDLKKRVRDYYFLPVPTYSIKKVAPFFGFSWRQKEVNAFESMVLYWDWLENNNDELIQKVLKYNEDDCLAMVYIDRKLFINDESKISTTVV